MSNLANKAMSFEISDYSLKEISDSQIMELEMKVVSEGNNRHGLPITREAIINSASTLIAKPVLFKFNKKTNDVMGHEVDEIACGVCCLTSEDYYFKEIDGKLWLIAKAYIWKMYFEEVINVFIRDEEKAISMEMFIVDSEDEEEDETLETITSFCFAGVTLLGNTYTPAIENANAVVTKYGIKTFETMVEDTKKLLFKDTTTKKEGKKLDKFNKKEFLKKYSMTANEMFELFGNGLKGMTYTDESGYECKKYWVRDFCNMYVYVADWEQETVMAIPYSFENKKVNFDFTNAKYARMTYVVDEEVEEEKEPDEMQLYANKQTKEAVEKLTTEHSEKVKEFETKITELEATTTELETAKTELETSKTEFESKITELEKEKDELTEFKANILQQEKENKINYAIESVKESLTEEQITEWKAKVEDFESVDQFTNAIQAFAYTQTKNVPENDGVTRIHIPNNTDNNKKKSLWD